MSNFKNLTSVPVARRNDLRVEWIPGCKPTALPEGAGTVFMSKGKVAWVTWDYNPQATRAVAVQALRVIL